MFPAGRGKQPSWRQVVRKSLTVHITQDSLGNTYDRAGGDYRNIKP
jgi:hypothetical protein